MALLSDRRARRATSGADYETAGRIMMAAAKRLSLATVALPSTLEAVKATRCAGGFAGLDSFERRRPLATMFLW
jgi:hypothetical protein